MKPITLVLLTASLLTAARHSWKTAKVLDFAMEKYKTGRIKTTNRYINVATDEFIYTVVTSDLGISLFRMGSGGPAVGPKGCRFIVNDNIQVEESKNHKTLYVIDADGKECKTEIFRQERRTQ